MISKKKLRQRLLDICNGAGYVWRHEDKYFEPQHTGYLGCAEHVIDAIARTFDLKKDAKFWLLNNLSSFEDIEDMTNFVHAVIENHTDE